MNRKRQAPVNLMYCVIQAAWGNRLFNLGSFLAPRYDAHIGWVAFTYRF